MFLLTLRKEGGGGGGGHCAPSKNFCYKQKNYKNNEILQQNFKSKFNKKSKNLEKSLIIDDIPGYSGLIGVFPYFTTFPYTLFSPPTHTHFSGASANSFPESLYFFRTEYLFSRQPYLVLQHIHFSRRNYGSNRYAFSRMVRPVRYSVNGSRRPLPLCIYQIQNFTKDFADTAS